MIRPESSYALSKVLGEEAARQFNRWSGIPIIGLRFSNIMERADYERFPSYWDYPQLRRWNLWSYVDESHVGLSVRRALEADLRGAEAFIIAAPDTVMRRPSSELMAESFPQCLSAVGSASTRRSSRSTRRAAFSATTPPSPGASSSERCGFSSSAGPATSHSQ